ncbi:MAG: bifunctional 4-hydroxy-3-methylbut-2-enyl diphosphate reductase/30S ribosomal protein S1 [Bacillota bacterium]|nr:bifunctional 4-hydroxy-3-methylbut-2-enyl diphosphate reductase/30S ribosomal protein S1 [Bacillota bacterium]
MSIEIIRAAHIGFCQGVRRAIDLAENAAFSSPICTLGPLIHNPQVIQEMSPRIRPVESLEEVEGGRVLIRSHGVAPAVLQRAAELGLEVLDATCPFVQRAQKLAKKLSDAGWQLVILGDSKHPEVVGICGWAGDRAWVIRDQQEAAKLPACPRIALLAQTTQREDLFAACAEAIRPLAGELLVENTICNHTAKLQESTAELAPRVDAMVVIGGRNSSNTKKLALISKEKGATVFHIEAPDEVGIDIVRGRRRIGISAGASTPQHIIEEVVTRMTELENKDQVIAEQSDADTFAQEYGDMKEIRRGARVKGVVVQVKDDELLVDIGGKSEGVLTASELTTDDAKHIRERFHIGDEIDVLILRKENQEGYPVLSKRRIDQDIAWDKLTQMKQDKEIVSGTVTDVVKGGVLVDVGVRGFVPASLVALGYVEDLNSYIGKELQMKIIECDKHSNKLVLSAKAVLRKVSQAQKEKTWAEIAEGQSRPGVVRRLTNFGAFVDIGGVDGLLHVSEMAWYRVNRPSDLLKEGDEIEVYILGVDAENEKISLGMKQLTPNPWSQAKDKYPEGCVIPAKVMRTTDFGAFLEVEPGVEGLVHISQLANHHVEKTEDVVKPGDMVEVKVISVDPEAKRMSLSIKATQPEEAVEAPVEAVEEAPVEEIPAE